MNVEEIFAELAAHQIAGFMTHEELANYYDFLSLHGYKRCHEYHYFEESIAYRRLCRYYVNHYNKLVAYREVDEPRIIPDSWERYTRQDVDATTKRNAVKSGIEAWVAWEKETKDLYQRAYKELLDLGEIAAAQFVSCLVCDVDKELKCAERKQLDLSAMGYDIIMIVAAQDEIHEKYKCKVEELTIEV